MWMLLSHIVVTGCNTIHADHTYQLTRIKVSETTLILNPGESKLITITAIPSMAYQPDFQWISANDTVATVINGWIKGLTNGSTVITVSCGDVQTEIHVTVKATCVNETHAILYEEFINCDNTIPELLLNGVAQYDEEGLNVIGRDNTVQLDKFYALGERKVQYTIVFSADAKAIFRSSEGDFNAYVDVPNKRISIATYPAIEQSVDFLEANQEYLVEVYHIYQKAKLRITDIYTGKFAEVEAEHDGQGGAGKGVLQQGFSVGMQWDHYCFGLISGVSMHVRKISVIALKKRVKLLMYGDSITQPEGYFPSSDFSLSWTQQILHKLKGNAMSSGRGGAQIGMILNYIKNELPYIEAKYVMVTIGTNGGNTEENLSQLINYIKAQGAIPILNNIPCNESGTHIENNKLIEQVRNKWRINGCKFDIATSMNGDGIEVDKSLMYWEDYSNSYGWQIFHHPNEKGGQKMFERTLIDFPEIYE